MNKIFYEFSLITKLRKSNPLAYVIKEIQLGITFPLAPSKVHCCFSIPHCSHYSDKWTKVQTIKNWKKLTGSNFNGEVTEFQHPFSHIIPPKNYCSSQLVHSPNSSIFPTPPIAFTNPASLYKKSTTEFFRPLQT